MKVLKFLACGLIVIPMLISSCKKEDAKPNPSTDQTSSMRVKMTDAPGNFSALNVNIISVQAYLENSGWVTLNNSSQTISVLNLTNGLSAQLAYSSNVSAGLYTKIKLVFGSSNQVVINASSSSEPLQTSGTFNLSWLGAKEVIIDINEEISADAQADILLDFDVASSIQFVLGEYVINPVVREIEDASTGISGTIQAGAHAAIIVTGPSGEINTFANASGQFKIYDLEPGAYVLKIYTTAAQIANGMPQEYTINGVIVTEGQFQTLGTINIQ